jgi:predicted aspartyl protease
MGNKQVVLRKLARAEAELEGIKRTIYITIGKDGERPLLGYTALEVFGFKVNPVTGKLERVAAVE